MNDMTAVIIPKSDQINADDLIAGPMTIRIAGVDIRPGTEQPVSIHFEGDGGKPWKPCKSMCRCLVAAWGPDAKVYVGRSMTIYRDPAVKWGGMEVGGIRISHMTHIDRDMVLALTATKGSRKPHTIKVLKEAPGKAEKITASLIAQIDGATSVADLEALTADSLVVSQRGWMEEKRPDLAQRVTEALSARLADFDRTDAAEESAE